MLLFLDTEFTDFPNLICDPISIGLVDENGREFYAELIDYRDDACSPFVRQNILPLLGKHKNMIKGTRFSVAKKLKEWLEPYRDDCVICFDYNTDWYLMRDMLIMLPEEDIPNYLVARNIWGQIDKIRLEHFWVEKELIGWRRHHSLWDAHGNRAAYLPK